MYIPPKFLAADKDEIIAFMQRFSFATIVTAANNLPSATHLPFLVLKRDGELILRSHFARANKQWEEVEGNSQVLVIFTEPHAYISPRNYEKELNVPTWNYISVHAYGRGRLINETEEVFALLEETITTYETGYKEHWDRLSQDFRLKMAKGIMAFEIVVTDLQAKKKLSQNRTETEQQRIIQTLGSSGRDNERLIAAYMEENLNALQKNDER